MLESREWRLHAPVPHRGGDQDLPVRTAGTWGPYKEGLRANGDPKFFLVMMGFGTVFALIALRMLQIQFNSVKDEPEPRPREPRAPLGVGSSLAAGRPESGLHRGQRRLSPRADRFPGLAGTVQPGLPLAQPGLLRGVVLFSISSGCSSSWTPSARLGRPFATGSRGCTGRPFPPSSAAGSKGFS